jgi:PAB-dependent poly(A)-specific ribonuclease subunit 2
MSLARVSVVRGQGEEIGKPFIDDHIYTTENVVDYLTEYSGIRRDCSFDCFLFVRANLSTLLDGDLDPLLSRKTLVPLKTAYKKLRLLVDLGCVFIGHGLDKDLRIISELSSLFT